MVVRMTSTTATDLVLRDATDADVPFLAQVMFAAQRSQLPRGVTEYMLDLDSETIVRFLERIAVTGMPHIFHASRFRIAELDRRPAGALSTYDRDQHGDGPTSAAMFALFPAFGLEPTDPEGWRRAGVVRSGIPAEHHGPSGPRLVVENVATLPSFRRRGVTRVLLQDAIAGARRDGYPAVQIGCYLGNEPARAAYLAAGFEVAGEARSDDWRRELGCDGTELLLTAL